MLAFIIRITAFTLILTQAPLYYSNQNQYLLHGVADARVGELHNDWLANTTDPTPLFTLLIRILVSIHPWLIHIAYAVIVCIYVDSLMRICQGPPSPMQQTQSWLVLGFLMVTHSGAMRWLCYRMFGQDFLWYLQSGVAGQYVLGGMFQPSTFGVFLLTSCVAFKSGKFSRCTLYLALACNMHSTYLLPSAFLVCGFIISLIMRRDRSGAIRVGLGALLGVTPIVTYTMVKFWPSEANLFAESQRILAQVRIPHHCNVSLWCDPLAIFQIFWIAAGIWLIRRTMLGQSLMIAFVLAITTTIIQSYIRSDSLSLMFPWRISAVLVPISTIVIIARIASRMPSRLEFRISAFGGLGLLTIAGFIMAIQSTGYASDPDEQRLLKFVQQNRKAGQRYLIPVRVPTSNTVTRGSISSDFKPIVAKKSDGRLIPVNLQGFRLSTGVPIFVDFKSVPYRDEEVLEWQRRMERNQYYLEQLNSGKVGRVLPELRQEGITHVVTNHPEILVNPHLKMVYRDDFYTVYELE